MKDCNKCGLNKNEDEFTKTKYGGLASWCNSCKREKARKWYSENKQKVLVKQKKNREKRGEWFIEYKKTLKCSECGENHPAVLDFHHLDPSEKEFNLSDQIWCRKKEDVISEINKCIVLCANCHRKLHWNKKQI